MPAISCRKKRRKESRRVLELAQLRNNHGARDQLQNRGAVASG